MTFPGPFSISDDKLGTLSCPAGSLAPDASVTCTASYTIKQGDLDASSITNKATASTTYGGNEVKSNEATATVTATQTPAITLTKNTTTASFDHVGQVINYTLVATNDGNVTLHDVSISDPQLGRRPRAAATLAPGDRLTCTGSHTVTQAILDAASTTTPRKRGRKGNKRDKERRGLGKEGTRSVSGKGPQDQPVQPRPRLVPAAQNPAISLTKSASPTTYKAIGDVISYSYVVKNTGNVTLPGPFSISDDKLGAISCPTGSLAPNVTVTCTASYTIKLSDLDAGSIKNTATASTSYGGKTITSDPADATVTAVQTSAITLTKAATPATYSKVGDVIAYTLVAKNTGNVTLHDVSITDPKLGTLTCTPSQPATLTPNATLSCTGSYTIQASDLVLGQPNKVTNTATANGKDPKNQPVSATATATVYQQTAALLPTQTTCRQYAAGPSAWPPMYKHSTTRGRATRSAASRRA